jgi:hypothetical protein
VKKNIHEMFDCSADSSALHSIDICSGDDPRQKWILGEALETLQSNECEKCNTNHKNKLSYSSSERVLSIRMRVRGLLNDV